MEFNLEKIVISNRPVELIVKDIVALGKFKFSKNFTWKRYNKLRDEFYSSKEWNDLRTKIFKKYNYKCQLCKGKASQVHHVVPIYYSPNLILDEDNLKPLCKNCHKVMHKY